MSEDCLLNTTKTMSSSQFPCGVCTNKTFKSKIQLYRHTNLVHRDKRKTCPVCKNRFSSENLRVHLQTHLPVGERNKLKCSVDQCSKNFLSRQGLKQHLAADHSPTPKIKLKCNECSKEYSSTNGLRQHVQQIHSGSVTKYGCSLCDSVFVTKYSRNSHIVAVHTGEKAFQCKECPAKFSTDGSLRGHQIVHTDAMPNKCEICLKQFKRKGDMASHIKRAHSQRTRDFHCSVCNKALLTKHTLSRHLTTHSQEVGSYSCYFCSKAFLNRGNQERHLRIHTQEKPFFCSEASCKYSSTCLSTLTSHVKRRHPRNGSQATPYKIYTCYFCSKNIIRSYYFAIHLRSHTQETPFPCNLCSKSFKSGESLQTHINAHTKEKPFHCSSCQKSFTARHNFTKHVAKHTKQT